MKKVEEYENSYMPISVEETTENFTDVTEYDFEDITYDESSHCDRPSDSYDGGNIYSNETLGKCVGPLVADTVKGVDLNDLLERHGMMIKYDDVRYEELFSKLKEGIERNGEIDEDTFNDIFFGKITAIAKNCYNSFKCSFVCEHIADIFNEAYMLIYKKSIHHFFYNADDSLPKDRISYLKWCKTCITNSIRSKLRGKKKIDLAYLRFDGYDDGENDDPVSTLPSFDPTPEQTVIARSMICEMFRYVARINSKPEKKLIWFAIQLGILGGAATDKIGANHMVYDKCGNMTVSEFAEYVISLADEIEWLELTSTDKEMLCNGVSDEKYNGKTLSALVSGDKDTEETFLKKISDWVFKINSSLSNTRDAVI